MKRFFIYFLASFLAFTVYQIITVIFFVILGVGLIVAISSGEDDGGFSIEDRTVLIVDLNQSYIEYPASQNIEGPLDILRLQESIGGELTSYELQSVIRRAASDERIEGIILYCGQESSSWAVNSSIREALEAFKKTEKFIIAYGDFYTEKNYFIASVADHIYLHPRGMFEWNGIAVRVTFYKKLFEKIGLKMQIYYAGNFKSATEPYRRENLSPYNKQQLGRIIHSFNDQMLDVVSQSRGIDVSSLKKYADNLDIFQAEDALKYKMVDELAIYSTVEDEIEKTLEDDEINYVHANEYANSVSIKTLINHSFDKKSNNEIAVVYMDGAIGEKLSITYNRFKETFKNLREDDDVKAVVIRVNSPGGSALESESILQEIKKLKSKKHVIVSMGGLAASGGYYISCYADSIFVSPYTLTGSIGVFAMIPTAENLLKDKLHLSYDEVSTSPHASLMSFLNRKLDKTEGIEVQRSVDSIYSTFLNRVSIGRGMDKQVAHSLAQGRIWTGTDAVSKKLADGIGNEDRAIRSAASVAELDDFYIRRYPQRDNFFDKLFKQVIVKTAYYTGLTRLIQQPVFQRLYQINSLERNAFIPQTVLPYELEEY